MPSKKNKAGSNRLSTSQEHSIDKNLDQKIDQLVRKRDALKSKLERFKTFLNNLKSITVESSQYIELDTRLRDLENNFLSEFNAIQLELENVDFDLYAEEEEGHFESNYYKVISEAKQFLFTLSNSNATQPAEPLQVGSNPRSYNNSRHSINVKLPSIELPKFSGIYEKWYDFKEIYVSLIHKVDFIDSVQKFHYLRTSLEGQALQCIKSIDMSGQNYEMAWNLLCERYDNKRLIIHKHIKSLFSLSEVKQDSSISIRSFIDELSKNLRSLENLGISTESWDPLIIYLVSSKLDNETIRYWEQYAFSNELPTLSELKKFLSSRADYLEKISLHKVKPKPSTPTNSHFVPKARDKCVSASTKGHQNNPSNYVCFYCNKQGHSIYKCQSFLRLSLQEKREKVNSLNLCLNCLQRNHRLNQCKSGPCKHCSEKHNSLLHPFNEQISSSNLAHTLPSNSVQVAPKVIQDNVKTTNGESQQHFPNESHNFSCHSLENGQVLLATALIEVKDANGDFHQCKALLDSGSMSNFISKGFAEKLNLSQNQVGVSISGINSVHAHVSRACDIQIKSINSNFQTELYCLIIPSITDKLPNSLIDTNSISIPSYIKLADPSFYQPSQIDILIGVGLFSKLLCNGRKFLGENMPVLQKSKLGWFLSGSIGRGNSKHVLCNFSETKDALQQQVSKFWEIEELISEQSMTNEELQAELNFQQTFRRNDEGRFVVHIPLKNTVSLLGNSRQTAARQFFSLEKRFSTNLKLKEMYTDFMQEYRDMSHMSPFNISDTLTESINYYSPHHAVLKEDSSTTKLRVVFNSSSPSSSGVSYNSLQMVGPTVQEDLMSILLRFRQHSYVVTADICKMYRQILIAEEFKALQLILWRSDPEENLQTYSLNTVMYGTASAPFLATRCLKQLAIDFEKAMPMVSEVIKRDFYVDDFLCGANSIHELQNLCKQVVLVLASAGFPLRKWKSNSQEILSFLAETNASSDSYYFNSSETSKTLGMLWSSNIDLLAFHIDFPLNLKAITKRVILSETAKIFDPLGLLGPIVIQAKIILQQLWSLKLGWDIEVPEEIARKWQTFRSELINLNSLTIPRHASCKNSVRIEVHGFSDASQCAYGACIYLRSIDSLNNVFLHLLTSKTRVAPLKAISIPKLELCGAALLAKLYKKVMSSLTCNIDCSYFWCDSTAVLGWVRSPSRNFQVFVGNRISEIQTLTPANSWRYVPTGQNPADYLSRGLTPRTLLDSKDWFNGPIWLLQDPVHWPIDISLTTLPNELPEMRKKVTVLVQSQQDEIFPFKQFSSFSRIKRVMAICLRFISNCKLSKNKRVAGNLSVEELLRATNKLIQLSQQESFSEDIKHLKKLGIVSNKSSLLSLAPFLNDGLIRVGGRLRQSPYAYDKKHPILLGSKHQLTYLIMKFEHYKLYHCGPQLLLSNVRERYWPISGKNLAKRIVRECVICFRFKPKFVHPMMGDLPYHRVSPSIPFTHVGVDYAGPFFYKDRKGRGAKHLKCYLCLFICLAVKAVHLELVSDLSTTAFLEGFQRFIARRGKPSHVYSDNGSNFIGANNKLHELGQFLRSNRNDIDVQLGTSLDIKWHFIPAYSPHQGGIWEAGIKSAKHHLLKILTSTPTTLTFESFSTVISQVEGVLNSRPLTALSNDPNDLNVLTPSHFLTGRAAESLPYHSLENIPTNRLTLYEQLEKIKQLFWKRWSVEYVSQLHERVKWKTKKCNLSVGDVVLIQDNDMPSFKWRLGRVCAVHPGNDGQVRVASVNTSSGVIKRAVAKLAPLPIINNSDS